MKITALTFDLLVLVITFVISCKSDVIEEVQKTPDGRIEKIMQYKQTGDQKKIIKETRFYLNGNKQIEGGYKDDQRDGKWTYWFENGNKQSEGYFEKGLRVGEAKTWDENGTPIYTGNYKKGKPDGAWYIYDKNGNKEIEIIYENGKVVKKTNLEK